MSYHLPTRSEIRKHAIRKSAISQITKMDIDPITPEEEEMNLRESQREIMSQDARALAEQHRYLNDMANELGMKLMSQREYREHQREKHRFESIMRMGRPQIQAKPQKIRLPKPKPISFQPKHVSLPKVPFIGKPKPKRRRNHSQRTSKTMRSIRHLKHVKVFSFPDSVWKVRKK